eukprot:5046224-Amphidinium_carterae.1
MTGEMKTKVPKTTPNSSEDNRPFFESIFTYCCECYGDCCYDSTRFGNIYTLIHFLCSDGIAQTGFLVFRVMTMKPQVVHRVSWGSTKRGLRSRTTCFEGVPASVRTHRLAHGRS